MKLIGFDARIVEGMFFVGRPAKPSGAVASEAASLKDAVERAADGGGGGSAGALRVGAVGGRVTGNRKKCSSASETSGGPRLTGLELGRAAPPPSSRPSSRSDARI